MLLKSRWKIMHFVGILCLLIANLKLSTNALQEHVCGTIEARLYKELEPLKNCTVVIGNVGIMLSIYGEDYTSEQINNHSFPLREVTGYMLFYQTSGLDSLERMFPNLTIIRGQTLFSTYSLLLYNTDLIEINLRNLLKINRGSVVIAGENSRLCMPKIHWDSIIVNGRLVIIGTNVTRSDCNSSRFDQCYTCGKLGACWNNLMCQRFDRNYTVEGTKNKYCHELCLGKCVNSTSKGCYVCRDRSELGECVKSCSSGRFFNAQSRRCITEDECIKLGKIIHERDCVQHCPTGYSLKYENMAAINHHCSLCEEKCPRICTMVPEIRTVANLEDMGTGCTIINGSLEINFIEDRSNLTAELQTYLGNVEEIHGNLKIHRSPFITSLTFLNKLRIVHGVTTNVSYSVLIFENENLQLFFDWTSRRTKSLDLKKGLMKIYNNYLLCETEIGHFKNIIKPKGSRHFDFIQRNGLERSCKKVNITTSYKILSHDQVEISWNESSHSQSNKTTGYSLHYVNIGESEQKDLEKNMLYERDSCSSYGWKNVIIKLTAKANFSYKLTGLMQYTYYAYTIQQHSNGSSNSSNEFIGAISDIDVFQTPMNVPSRVTDFMSPIKSKSMIKLKWNVLEKEEKAIDRILLFIYENAINLEQIDARDYCMYPINYNDTSVISNKSEEEDKDINIDYLDFLNNVDCCEKCCMRQKLREKFVYEEKSFEESLIEFSSDNNMKLNPKSYIMRMKNLKGFKYFIDLNGNVREYDVMNLIPYTHYTFRIAVCAGESCSNYEILDERTALDELFDKIELIPMEYVYHMNDTKIHFDEPSRKNGAIISYTIEIHEIVGGETFVFMRECITRAQHAANNYEFSFNQIYEGDFLFRIRAISLAQVGVFTDWHHFKVIFPKKEMKEKSTLKRVLVIAALSIPLVLIIAFISYYYKHKIMILLKLKDDTRYLMHEMEPTDFRQMSLHHELSDSLSDMFQYNHDS